MTELRLDRTCEPWKATFPTLGTINVHADGSLAIDVEQDEREPLELPLQIRRKLAGSTALQSRLRHEWWLAHSAPTWSIRRAWAIHLAVPLWFMIEPLRTATPLRSAHSWSVSDQPSS